MFIIDDEELRQLKSQEQEDVEIEITKDQRRRMQKCKRNLEINTRNLVRFLLKNEHDMAIIRELVGSPNEKYAELIKNLRSLRVIMLKKLGTAAEEEKRSRNLLKEL